MRHFVYTMRSEDPAPAGDGDTGSWFRHYKWAVDDQVFVPKRYPFLDATEVDYLWFSLDGVLLGGVPLDAVDTPSTPTQRQELSYHTKKILEMPPGCACEWEGEVTKEQGDKWLRMAWQKRS